MSDTSIIESLQIVNTSDQNMKSTKNPGKIIFE